MKNIAIIPARMSSSRYPGKPLVKILGLEMIGHVYKRTEMSNLVDITYVATCDKVIFKYIQSIGGNVVMTSNLHERAIERTAEALLTIEDLLKIKFNRIVMVQGDEPLVYPKQIDDSLKILSKNKIMISNIMKELNSIGEVNNPNNVKVVLSEDNNALYFSRSKIPFDNSQNNSAKFFRQLGLISFIRDSLLLFVNLKPSKLEIIESIDMNRFLENHILIKMIETRLEADAIDVPSDLKRVEVKMKKDTLFQIYGNED